MIKNQSNRQFERVRAGTPSPFDTQYERAPASENKVEPSVALKKPVSHPLDELEAAVPDMINRKYDLFKKDLLEMFSKAENNLNEIEMRQKEVRHYAEKNNLGVGLVTEWPVNLIFYLLIFERMSHQEVLAIEEYAQLGWTPEALAEARGISESLEFKREIYAYKGILEDVLAAGNIAGETREVEASVIQEPKKSWVDELSSPTNEETFGLSQRIKLWDEREQSAFQKQIQADQYSQSEIEEMISGRDFKAELYDY